MKYIKKGKEPNSLTQYRQQTDVYFDGYKNKKDLRTSLLKEQKYICCYCMCRISKDKVEPDSFGKEQMRIEHWMSQSEHTELELTYSNLLGACTGNKGKPKHLEHCDVSRKNIPLKINPTLPTCESLIKYRRNGEIYSDDCEVNKDLDETLNLNNQTLRKNRELVLNDALKSLGDRKMGLWNKEILQREINKWKSINNSEHKAYCQIVIYHLKKKLVKLV